MRPFDDIEKDNAYMKAFREGSEAGFGVESKTEYLYLVGKALGYKRLTKNRLDELSAYLRIATRRRIYLKPSEVGGGYGYCRPRNMGNYFPDYFDRLAVEAIKERGQCASNEIIGVVAGFLGFQDIDEEGKTSISGGIDTLIENGILTSENGRIRAT